MKTVAIVQARLGSTRFPKKMFAEIENKTLIDHVFLRLENSKEIDQVVLATTENELDDELCDWAQTNGIDYFRGSETNVLERYYFAALKFKADIIVRITGDDPLKDVNVIDQVICVLKTNDLDFSYNNFPPSFPEGMDCEVFTMDSLKIAFENAVSDFEQEHVTQYMYKNLDKFKHSNYSNELDYSNLRWTIDTIEDLEMVQSIYSHLYRRNPLFGWQEVIQLLTEFPEISSINNKVNRSHLYKK
jgi:spore coat polysaccharide biosynthesis protein SpsF